jgi:vacuolar-type H+-ATPase subunit E/Vma4
MPPTKAVPAKKPVATKAARKAQEKTQKKATYAAVKQRRKTRKAATATDTKAKREKRAAAKATRSTLEQPKQVEGQHEAKTLKKLSNHRNTQNLYARILAAAKAKKVTPTTLIRRSSKIVEKQIGGENNGKTRKVIVGKSIYI